MKETISWLLWIPTLLILLTWLVNAYLVS